MLAAFHWSIGQSTLHRKRYTPPSWAYQKNITKNNTRNVKNCNKGSFIINTIHCITTEQQKKIVRDSVVPSSVAHKTKGKKLCKRCSGSALPTCSPPLGLRLSRNRFRMSLGWTFLHSHYIVQPLSSSTEIRCSDVGFVWLISERALQKKPGQFFHLLVSINITYNRLPGVISISKNLRTIILKYGQYGQMKTMRWTSPFMNGTGRIRYVLVTKFSIRHFF